VSTPSCVGTVDSSVDDTNTAPIPDDQVVVPDAQPIDPMSKSRVAGRGKNKKRSLPIARRSLSSLASAAGRAERVKLAARREARAQSYAAPVLLKREVDSVPIGCNLAIKQFATDILRATYAVGFSLVPVCMFAFVVGVLGANHIYSD
jgi:hypothetical protein